MEETWCGDGGARGFILTGEDRAAKVRVSEGDGAMGRVGKENVRNAVGNVVGRISGGLGNQLFRHAASLALARRTNRALRYDLSDYLVFRGRQCQVRQFDGPARIARWNLIATLLFQLAYAVDRKVSARLAERMLRLQGVHRFRETSPWSLDRTCLDPDTGRASRTLYLDGNCQHLGYLPDDETLRREFALRDPPCPENRVWMDLCLQGDTVAVHVRRGDYLGLSGSPVLGIAYYEQAAARIREQVADPRWLVFSDDIPWCRIMLPFLRDARFVSGNQERPWEDLRLMAACRHHIIANSTFSWWGAALGRDSGGVTIAPEQWFAGVATAGCLLKPGWLTAPSFKADERLATSRRPTPGG